MDPAKPPRGQFEPLHAQAETPVKRKSLAAGLGRWRRLASSGENHRSTDASAGQRASVPQPKARAEPQRRDPQKANRPPV